MFAVAFSVLYIYNICMLIDCGKLYRFSCSLSFCLIPYVELGLVQFGSFVRLLVCLHVLFCFVWFVLFVSGRRKCALNTINFNQIFTHAHAPKKLLLWIKDEVRTRQNSMQIIFVLKCEWNFLTAFIHYTENYCDCSSLNISFVCLLFFAWLLFLFFPLFCKYFRKKKQFGRFFHATHHQAFILFPLSVIPFSIPLLVAIFFLSFYIDIIVLLLCLIFRSIIHSIHMIWSDVCLCIVFFYFTLFYFFFFFLVAEWQSRRVISIFSASPQTHDCTSKRFTFLLLLFHFNSFDSHCLCGLRVALLWGLSIRY